jgi:hypothetical protein
MGDASDSNLLSSVIFGFFLSDAGPPVRTGGPAVDSGEKPITPENVHVTGWLLSVTGNPGFGLQLPTHNFQLITDASAPPAQQGEQAEAT